MGAGHGLVASTEPLWTMRHMNDPTATYDPDTDSVTISGGGQPKTWSASPDGLIECGIDADRQWVALRVHDASSSFGPCIGALTGGEPTTQWEEALLEGWFPRGPEGCRVVYKPQDVDVFEVLWDVRGVVKVELLPDGSFRQDMPIPDVLALDIANGVNVYVEESHPVGFSIEGVRKILGPVLASVLR